MRTVRVEAVLGQRGSVHGNVLGEVVEALHHGHTQQVEPVLGGSHEAVDTGRGHPHRRIRILHGPGVHGDVGDVPVLVLDRHRLAVGRQQCHHGLDVGLPQPTGLLEGLTEHLILERRRTSARTELDPAVRDDVQSGDPLGGAHRMGEGQQHHAQTEADVTRLSGGGRQHQIGSGRMGEPAGEMVLDEPHRAVAEVVGGGDRASTFSNWRCSISRVRPRTSSS